MKLKEPVVLSGVRAWFDFRQLDVVFIGLVGFIMAFGLVMTTSASIGIAEKQFGDELFFFRRQLLFSSLGLVVVLVFSRIPLVVWEKLAFLFLLGSFLLLLLVLIPGLGLTLNGSTRWLDLGIVTLQASEMAKLFFLLYLASYLLRQEESVRSRLLGFLKPLLLMAVLSGLLLLEPDFGSAVVLTAMGLVVLFIAGVRLSHFSLLLVIVIGLFVVFAISTPYRLERLTSFVNPWADPFSSGFQLTQSLIAIGSGSWFGQGLGAGVQKLFYLPEAHNDFLFAVIAEELGLLGVLLVLVLFSALIWRCFQIAILAEKQDRLFGAYLSFGVATWVGFQVIINLGVNMGLLPTKGLNLPLMSTGGSSMLVMCAALGLVLRTALETQQKTGKVRYEVVNVRQELALLFSDLARLFGLTKNNERTRKR